MIGINEVVSAVRVSQQQNAFVKVGQQTIIVGLKIMK